MCPKSETSSYYFKKMFFKIAPEVTKDLDSFCKKSCRQGLWKIAQSGHTVFEEHLITVNCILVQTNIKDNEAGIVPSKKINLKPYI